MDSTYVAESANSVLSWISDLKNIIAIIGGGGIIGIVTWVYNSFFKKKTKMVGYVINAATGKGIEGVNLHIPHAEPEKRTTIGGGRFIVDVKDLWENRDKASDKTEMLVEIDSETYNRYEPPNGLFEIKKTIFKKNPPKLYVLPKGSKLILNNEGFLKYLVDKIVNESPSITNERSENRNTKVREEAKRYGLDYKELEKAIEKYRKKLIKQGDEEERGDALFDEAKETEDPNRKSELFVEVHENYDNALEKMRNNEARIHYKKGNAYYDALNYSSAAEQYWKGVKLTPDDTNLLNALGTVLYYKGEYAAALINFMQSIILLRQLYGKNNPEVATGLNNIGMVYDSQGKYEEALQNYEEALKIDESYYGRNHPNIAVSLNNIGGVYQDQGKYEEALKNYEEALKIDESYHGRNHPDVAIDLNNIGGVYKAQGKYEEALKNYEAALEVFKNVYGEIHPNVATSLNNIGGVYRVQGKYEEALQNYEETLEILKNVYGEIHPNIAASLNNIGGVYRVQGKYEEALQNYEEALEIDESSYGRNHPNVAIRLNNIGEVYRVQGKYEEALKCWKEAKEITQQFLPPEHEYNQNLSEKIAELEKRLSQSSSGGGTGS